MSQALKERVEFVRNVVWKGFFIDKIWKYVPTALLRSALDALSLWALSWFQAVLAVLSIWALAGYHLPARWAEKIPNGAEVILLAPQILPLWAWWLLVLFGFGISALEYAFRRSQPESADSHEDQTVYVEEEPLAKKLEAILKARDELQEIEKLVSRNHKPFFRPGKPIEGMSWQNAQNRDDREVNNILAEIRAKGWQVNYHSQTPEEHFAAKEAKIKADPYFRDITEHPGLNWTDPMQKQGYHIIKSKKEIVGQILRRLKAPLENKIKL